MVYEILTCREFKMGKFRYRVYYDYVESACAEPLPTSPKNDGEIAQALRNFTNDLKQCLPENAPSVRSLPDARSMEVVFETSLCEADVIKLVEGCLKDLHLCGRQLEED